MIILFFTELQNSIKAGKTATYVMCGFFVPEFRPFVMVGRLGEYNTRKGNTLGSAFCCFEPPGHSLEGITQLQNCKRRTTLKERKLTVSKDFHEYQLRRYSPGEPVPWIRLKGFWLKEAGFVIGLPIRVQVEEQQLVITPRT